MLTALIALGGCAAVNDDLSERYTAYLGGGSIAPGQKGHLYGSGFADFWVGKPPLLFCYRLRTDKVGTVTSAHLHRAPEFSIGLPVLDLDAPTAGYSHACTRVSRRLMADLRAEPEAFYVDIHTPEFPLGALRGQLERESPEETLRRRR